MNLLFRIKNVFLCVTLLFLCLIISSLSYAKGNTKDKKHIVSGSVQLGGVLNTGNSDAKNINGKSEVKLHKNKWLMDFISEGELNTSRGETTAEKLALYLEGRYYHSERGYFFIKGRSTYDAFATFDLVMTESVGYGSMVYKTEKMQLTLEAGPGGRHSRISGLKTYQNEFVVNGNGVFQYQFSKSAQFKQSINVDVGHDNSNIKAVSAIKTRMMKQLALEISYTIEHDTTIPEGSKNTQKTDTVSKIAIVYDF